ncbi:MAG TPA: hypothetical protein VFO49_01310 [Nocardioides sp.]|nr:hypothetical protein [Nocardioides sp.]
MNDRVPAWEQILDHLDGECAGIELALEAGEPPSYDPWEPPTGAGPLPAYLRTRAEQVLARQQRAIAAVSRAASTAARHQQLNGRLRSGTSTAQASVYVDVRA